MVQRICVWKSIYIYIYRYRMRIITIRMKHFRDKANRRRFVWIFFGKNECQLKCTVFKWCIMRSAARKMKNNDAIYIYICEREWERYKIIYPKITAFQSIILLSVGAPLTPTGGSSWSRLKSRIRRRLAGVDIFIFSFSFSFTIFAINFVCLIDRRRFFFKLFINCFNPYFNTYINNI